MRENLETPLETPAKKGDVLIGLYPGSGIPVPAGTPGLYPVSGHPGPARPGLTVTRNSMRGLLIGFSIGVGGIN